MKKQRNVESGKKKNYSSFNLKSTAFPRNWIELEILTCPPRATRLNQIWDYLTLPVNAFEKSQEELITPVVWAMKGCSLPGAFPEDLLAGYRHHVPRAVGSCSRCGLFNAFPLLPLVPASQRHCQLQRGRKNLKEMSCMPPVSVVSIPCSAETCVSSGGPQPEGPRFVIWLQEFPFGSFSENRLGNGSILATPAMLPPETFLLGFWWHSGRAMEKDGEQGESLARVLHTGCDV